MKRLRDIVEAKEPIKVSVEDFKRDKDQYRPAGLYEVDRKQIYHIDVPKGHFYHKRPFVKK